MNRNQYLIFIVLPVFEAFITCDLLRTSFSGCKQTSTCSEVRQNVYDNNTRMSTKRRPRSLIIGIYIIINQAADAYKIDCLARCQSCISKLKKNSFEQNCFAWLKKCFMKNLMIANRRQDELQRQS